MSFGVLLKELGAAILAYSLWLWRALMRREFDKHKTMSVFDELPIEILAHIFSYLPAKDIVTASCVCKRFYEANLIESIWMKRCQIDYGIRRDRSYQFSYKEVYSKVLHKYGKLIGLWQPQVSSYGGLLKVEFDQGRLLGTELHCSLDLNIKLPLKKRLLFVIGLDAEGQIEVLCVGSRQSSHRADIDIPLGNKFFFKCCDPDAHKQVTGRHQALIDWLSEQSHDASDLQMLQGNQELILFKFYIMSQYNYCFKFRPVIMPSPLPSVPIQPGLFKGTYGAHGIELVMLNYDEEDASHVKAIKISGDPNVPAGQVTFQVDLHYPMVVSIDQQDSTTRLEAIEAIKYDLPHDMDLRQSFKLPQDCFERFKYIPKTCTSRYFGHGQIAGQGFTNPSFSHGHWVVFSEDLFGFLWLDLLSLSMYHRVSEL